MSHGCRCEYSNPKNGGPPSPKRSSSKEDSDTMADFMFRIYCINGSSIATYNSQAIRRASILSLLYAAAAAEAS